MSSIRSEDASITVRKPFKQPTSEQLRQLEVDGYVVLSDVFSSQDCDQWTSLIDDIWKSECSRPRTYDYLDEPGVQFVPNLLRHAVTFERCVVDSAVLNAVRSVLGSEIVFSLANSRRTDPGYGNQPLHQLDRRRGKPYHKCDAIWCLDDFTDLNGTRVLPGSHLTDEPFLRRMKDAWSPHPDERIVSAPRGSVVVFNASLIHSGSMNGENRPRRSIQTQFVLAGDRTKYDWSTLPRYIKHQLKPQCLVLLGLAGEV